MRDKLPAASEHRGDLWFHFDSSAKPFLDAALRDAESGFSIWSFGNGSWVEEESWISHCYGQRERAKAFAFSVPFRRGDEVISFLLPQNAETAWQVREIPAEDGRAFEVDGGKTRDLVMIRGGEWRWVRSVGDKKICVELTE